MTVLAGYTGKFNGHLYLFGSRWIYSLEELHTTLVYMVGEEQVRLADRQAAHVRFAAIAVAAGLTAFLLAVVAGVIV